MGLKHANIITDDFISVSSKIVFTITLPTLVFLKVATLNVHTISDSLPAISVICAVTVAVFISTWGVASRCITQGKDMGAFMQGIYRGNFATVGLAASASLYGSEGLAQAALFLAFVVPLYNVLGVVALTLPLKREQQVTVKKIIKEIFLNPIVIGVFFAIPFAILGITIPDIIYNTASYLAELTIPLALLGIGGGLTFHQRDYSIKQAMAASLVKVIVMPVVGVIIALTFKEYGNLSNQTMGILFILFACPTTSATFIMAQAMGANSRLASAIVVISTSLAAFTMGLGLYLLNSYSII